MTTQAQLAFERILRVVVSIGLALSVIGTPTFIPLAEAKTETAAQPASKPQPETRPEVEMNAAASAAPQPALVVPTFDSPLPPPPPPVVNPLVVSDTVQLVTPAGGRVSSADHHLRLDVPPGLFRRTTRVKIAPRAGVAANAPMGVSVQFDLTARDVASDTLITAFDQPITLTVDLNGLIDRDKLQPFEHLAIYYQTDNPDAPWSELVDAREVEPGIVQVPLTHFSVYAAGSSGDVPASWHLKYNPPVVSTFSGAATFNYPIEVAPGRHGLQPNVALAYSSRSADGVTSIGGEDTDGMPFAWALDMASIARNGMEYRADGANKHMYFPERFSLAINGSNYDIFPETVGAHCGRYVAKEAPGLYIERHNDATGTGPGCNTGSTVNTTHEYWIVKTGDGTTYRFGYTTNSEQYVEQNAAFAWAEGYAGARCADGDPTGGWDCWGAASRWRVDQVTNLYNNSMTFAYHETSTTETPPGNPGQQPVTTQHLRVSSIDYNGNLSGVQFTNSTNDTYNWIDRIRVYNNGNANKIREYQLQWDGYSQRLLSITPYDGGTPGVALPATTFTHIDLDHDNNLPFPYIQRIDNGYGGATEFTYDWDGRVEESGLALFYGYSYRVIETRTYDGVNPTPARRQYAYNGPCYDQWQLTWNPGLKLCKSANAPEYGPLIGYETVTETVLNYDGTTAAISAHRYYTEVNTVASPLRGREVWNQTLDPSGTPLVRSDSAYLTMTIGGGTIFTYLSQADETTYASGTSVTKRTRYDYDARGHVSKVREYAKSSDATPYRTTTTDYVANEGMWIVDTPLLVRTYAGDAVVGTELKRVGYYYDRNPDGTLRAWGAQPLRGEMVFEDTYGYQPGQPDVHTWTNNWYDTYGNLTATADAKGNTTRTSYDTTYNLYPVQIVNAKTQTTTLAYNLALGLLTQTTDPNGAVTQYQYDTFGRLLKVIRPYDDTTNPTVRYEYRDPKLSVTNGGFEINGYWSQVDPSGIQYVGYTTEYRRSGSNSLKIIAYATNDNHWVYQDVSNWEPGRTYWLSAYVMTTVGGQLCLSVATKPSQELSAGCITASSAWQLVQGPVTLPSDATMFQLRLRTPVMSTVYVDEVRVASLVEVGTYTKDSASGTLWSREIADGLGRTIQTQMEKDNNQAVVVDTAYDSRNQVVTQTMPVEATSAATGLKYLPPDWTRPRTTTVYEALGRPSTATGPDNTRTEYRYELIADNGVTYFTDNVVDANRHRKQYRRDTFGRLSKVLEYTGDCNALGFTCAAPYTTPWAVYATTHYTYTVLDNLTQVRDQAGSLTSMSYDSFGRKLSMNDPDMGAWDYQYDAVGNLAMQDDASHQRTCFYYDQLNRPTGKYYTSDTTACATSNPPLVITYTYDQGTNGIGHRNRMDDASGYTTWTYDPRGRLTQESKTINGATGAFNTSYAYDAMDRVITTTYPSTEVVVQTYNAAAQLTQVRSQTYGLNYASGMQYNANGSLARLNLGNGLSTLYGYFGLSANQWDVRPGIGLGAYGRLWRARTEAPTGAVLQDIRYAYDNVGNVTYVHEQPRSIGGSFTPTLNDPFTTYQSTIWTLGPSGVTIPHSDGGNAVARFIGTGTNWDANMSRAAYALTTGKGLQVRFKLPATTANFVLGIENNDTANRRLAVYGDGTGKLRVQYNDGNGWRYPVALTPTLQANTWYTLTILVDDLRGNTLEVYSAPTGPRYTYNIGLASGKQWRFHAWTWSGTVYLDDYKEFTGGATVTPDERMQFTYDALDRLLSANKTTVDGYTQSYGYDPIGNIISTTMRGNYLYNASASGCTSGTPLIKPHAASQAGSTAYRYSYDCNGNMTQRIENNVTYAQTWTKENRVETVSGNGQSATYTYDGDGNRVKKVQNGVTTVYIGAIYEKNLNASEVTTYYFAGSQRVAMRKGGVPTWFVTDHLGSTSLALDASGNEIANSRQKYYPFGETRSGNIGTDRRYTGQREEKDLGSLYDYNARFYSSVLGRFLSADTIVPEPYNPQAWNRYAYTSNNPLKYTDPTGHEWCYQCESGGAGLLGYGEGGGGSGGSDELGIIALAGVVAVGSLIGVSQGSAVVSTLSTAAKSAWVKIAEAVGLCVAANCPERAKEAIQTVNKVCGGDCSDESNAIKQFVQDAIRINPARVGDTFGARWQTMVDGLARSRDRFEMFAARIGDRITGLMQVARQPIVYNGENALLVRYMEGLGGGAGTALLQKAYQFSLESGFGGRILLFATEKSMQYYMDNFPGFIYDPAQKIFYWSAEAAKAAFGQ